MAELNPVVAVRGSISAWQELLVRSGRRSFSPDSIGVLYRYKENVLEEKGQGVTAEGWCGS
jgi:hypothetical protein